MPVENCAPTLVGAFLFLGLPKRSGSAQGVLFHAFAGVKPGSSLLQFISPTGM